jgi:hypothetical protein
MIQDVLMALCRSASRDCNMHYETKSTRYLYSSVTCVWGVQATCFGAGEGGMGVKKERTLARCVQIRLKDDERNHRESSNLRNVSKRRAAALARAKSSSSCGILNSQAG